MKIINKYLQTEQKETCAHCHKSMPAKGSTVCEKCKKELESFRSKK
jgi:uncharacterized paraquat-inducible protein A